MTKLSIRTGDKVKVIAGKDKGLIGEVIAVDPQAERVTVQGVNIVKRHVRQNPQAPNRNTDSGIVSSEAPIHVSNVQLVVRDGNEDVVTRVGYRREPVTKRRSDGTEFQSTRSVRIARKTGKEI